MTFPQANSDLKILFCLCYIKMNRFQVVLLFKLIFRQNRPTLTRSHGKDIHSIHTDGEDCTFHVKYLIKKGNNK
jgi:hypothetical protein